MTFYSAMRTASAFLILLTLSCANLAVYEKPVMFGCRGDGFTRRWGGVELRGAWAAAAVGDRFAQELQQRAFFF